MDKTFIEGIQARSLANRLHDALNSGARWLQRELETGAIRIELPPDQKEVLRETAFMVRANMAEFCRQAVIEKLQRVHAEKVAAMEAAEKEAA